MYNEINNTQNTIDSVDIIERIGELEAERQGYQGDLAEWDASDEAKEFKGLQALQEEAGGYSPDWDHGTLLIRDSYFTEYAEDLAYDIGAVDDDMQWPLRHIDWEAAAEELKVDYTSVTFDGEDYWVQ